MTTDNPSAGRWLDRVWALSMTVMVAVGSTLSWVIWTDHEITQKSSIKLDVISDDLGGIKRDMERRSEIWYSRREAGEYHAKLDDSLRDHETRIRVLERPGSPGSRFQGASLE